MSRRLKLPKQAMSPVPLVRLVLLASPALSVPPGAAAIGVSDTTGCVAAAGCGACAATAARNCGENGCVMAGSMGCVG